MDENFEKELNENPASAETVENSVEEAAAVTEQAAEQVEAAAEEITEDTPQTVEEAAVITEETAAEVVEETAEDAVFEDIYSGASDNAEEETNEPQAIEYTEAQPEPQQGEYHAPDGNVNPYSSHYRQSFGGQGQYSQFAPAAQSEIKNEKSKKGAKIFVAAVALILVFALGFGAATISGSKKKNGNEVSEEASTMDNTKLEIKEAPETDKKKANETLTPAEIAEKVRECNVGIVVYSSGNKQSVAGEGSGVVMGLNTEKNATYIITCAHVIDGSGIEIKAQTEDGQMYDAEVVGFDKRTDLGVIKVNNTKLTAAEFGDSEALKIGDPVYAVGNPGGVEFFGSFTGGFVSAINRPVSSEIGYTMKCIQHDASINPGNSGGMLVNAYGQVIGINSQKIADTDYEGMGFAIPISSAREIIENLIQFGYIPNRPKLGITYYPVSASNQYYMIAQIKGLPAGTLIINDIGSDSSLANTNARKYDMIIAANGKPLTTADVLLELIDNGKVGDKITLTLCRVNSNFSIDEFDVEITLVEDKGDVEETTTEAYVNPFDSFFGYGQ